jgi:hypothetical protein
MIGGLSQHNEHWLCDEDRISHVHQRRCRPATMGGQLEVATTNPSVTELQLCGVVASDDSSHLFSSHLISSDPVSDTVLDLYPEIVHFLHWQLSQLL